MASHHVRAPGWLASLLLLLGCSGGAAAPVCAASARQAIVETDGGNAVNPDALPEAQAIGAIENDVGTLFCTGTLVRHDWVLSAAHCASAIDLRFRVASGDASGVTAALGEVVAYPSADLALLPVVSPDLLSRRGIRPLALAPDLPTKPATAELAGVGATERGASGALRLVAEPVVRIDAEHIEVDGAGKSGACAGDSGGPLLLPTRNGELEIVGVLHEGAASCRGVDSYTRIDAYRSWITATIGPEPACGE